MQIDFRRVFNENFFCADKESCYENDELISLNHLFH